MEIIVSHAGADFDAYASMVAAQRLYPQAKLVTMGKPGASVREFLHLHQGQFPVLSAKQVDPAQVTRLVMVDTSNPRRLGPFRLLAQQSGVEVHIYDHHPPSAECVHGDVSHIEMLGAAVTVVLKQLPRETKLSVAEATLFLIAIYEETGNLTYASTTPTDLRTAAWLLEQGAKLSVVNEILQQPLSQEQRELRDQMMANARRINVDGAQALLLTASVPHYVEEMNEVVWRLLQQEPVDIVLASVSMGYRIYLIGRSRHPRFNLLSGFQALGGGGHPCAASASVADGDPQDAMLRLLENLKFGSTQGDLVRDHMSPRVDPIDLSNCTVAQADQRLRELGRTATVVLKEGQVVGMLARSDLDKALAHNLGEMPAESVMTRPVLSVAPETSLDEARAKLVQHNVGRLPVMEDGKLLGIISRTDLLRHLYDTTRLRAPSEEAAPSDFLLQLPYRSLELLKQAGSVAWRCGVEVFAVGGFVRDLLLRRLDERTWDLDLCVEGTVDHFLDELATLWAASVHRHPRFETATLILPDGQKVDVARARQESYVRPAALPEVHSSNLKQDLFRRDFTINALAVRLTEGHFGELVDFFGGQADLAGQTIRVLHNHSFIDDPTRILRAVRLEQRLGFHLGNTTENLLRGALQQRILPLAGPQRIRDEIVLCLSEKQAVTILERLNKLRVLVSLHPDLVIDAKVRQLLQAVPPALEALSSRLPVEPWRVYVRAWLNRWKPEPLKELLRYYHFHLNAQNPLPDVLWRLARDNLSNSQLYATLKPLAADEMVVLWALNRDSKVHRQRSEERILRYLDELADLKPLLDGEAILRAGVPQGPEVARIKKAAFEAQLDQGWTSVAQAQNWLKGRGDEIL
ncbi:CBS domain-containing protein [bacterium]|nr:CBS domain-containing protein [bacterium]